MVPLGGSLEATGDLFEPYRLRDPAGVLVGPVAAFLRDLQACGRPETTLRAYAIALLRWFRFLWAAGVPWDQATRAEARDFSRWIQIAVKPGRAGGSRRCGQGRCRRGLGQGTQSGDRQGAAWQRLCAGHGHP